MPGGDPEARAYSPQIAPKWISADGKRFWLVWTDLKGIRNIAQAMDEPGEEEETDSPPPDNARESALEANSTMHSFMPGYGFNAQLIELDVE